MSAYLKFFDLDQSPFEGKAQAQVVLGTRALRDALATIQTGLAEGASRICVSGGRGLGKTSLARALPKLLSETARVALVLDPTLSWDASRGALAKQWGLESGRLGRAHLLEAARDRRLVLVIDQAERASEEFLDHLDVVLSYRSEDGHPVVQSVLLARLTTTQGEAPSPLIWWLDRIQTLQLQFSPLPHDGIASYIDKHLKRAGWRGERLFSEDAAHAIHGYTGGVPGAVSGLCEELLCKAAAQDLVAIDAAFVRSICEAGEEDEREEEVWTLEDEFEELALEDEFVDADPLAKALAQVETALEPFREAEEARWPEEPYGAEEVDPLDAPPTKEELRAILGRGITPMLRNLAAAAIAAIVGGIGFAMWSGDPEAARPANLSDSLTRTTPKPGQPDTRALRSSATDSARPTPSQDARPLVLIQPGGGFVPIERLQEIERRKAGRAPPSTRK
jgi:MSHA biogenesis protein MshM